MKNPIQCRKCKRGVNGESPKPELDPNLDPGLGLDIVFKEGLGVTVLNPAMMGKNPGTMYLAKIMKALQMAMAV